ncbi:DUF2243 domain-containing protein [Nocardioides panzhihuensis]|uniref:Putative membrane protein n=1 Tax=Nocardioides panzhihuensis TaxID=860243 RepID=A0A7Z0DSE1_9ACTN|nr:DUF2243 domain-containing protein [Nocardioides panzhihuensis]NYI80905.1 putative membrane protein [Nocardioides panzhihuensis]
MSTDAQSANSMTSTEPRSLMTPGIVLGVGIGGFVDGILLHQVLQWHHMLTSTNTDNVGIRYYPQTTVHGLQMNTVWDGLFHTFTWVMVLLGIALLYSRVQHSRGRVWVARALWGWILVGWGVFNLVEGIIDHHILGIHHVRSGDNQMAWDLAFLALGVLLVIAGWLLQRGASYTDATKSPNRPTTTRS